ncbi:MAG: ROK family protein [Candidatus Omnitrophota bacterium]
MKKKFIIGIDLGGTNLKIALLDSNCRILKKEVVSTRRFAEKASLIQALCDSVNRTIGKNHLTRKEIVGVGLGLPGPIDHRLGLVHYFPNIPGWKEVNLRSILKKKLKLPIFLDNDANVMALAEYALGAGRSFKNILCLTLGTGVGGGLVIQGKLYRGKDNAAGEFGHLPINEKGPSCNCGGQACLESYIGNNRILAEARRVFHRAISLEELSALAKKGNKRAKAIWLRVAERLGVALAGMANLLNLDAVIIGGGVAGAGTFFFQKIRDTIKKRAMSVQAKRMKVLTAKLGSDAGMVGAALLVKQDMKG